METAPHPRWSTKHHNTDIRINKSIESADDTLAPAFSKGTHGEVETFELALATWLTSKQSTLGCQRTQLRESNMIIRGKTQTRGRFDTVGATIKLVCIRINSANSKQPQYNWQQ